MSQSHEFKCDFPNCANHFDITVDARVAAIRNGGVVAFCHKHSKYLLAQGVNLRMLDVVRAEYKALHRKTPEPTAEELLYRQVREFIASLR